MCLKRLLSFLIIIKQNFYKNNKNFYLVKKYLPTEQFLLLIIAKYFLQSKFIYLFSLSSTTFVGFTVDHSRMLEARHLSALVGTNRFSQNGNQRVKLDLEKALSFFIPRIWQKLGFHSQLQTWAQLYSLSTWTSGLTSRGRKGQGLMNVAWKCVLKSTRAESSCKIGVDEAS